MAWKTKKYFECDRCNDEFSDKEISEDAILTLKRMPLISRQARSGETLLLDGVSLCPKCGEIFLRVFKGFMKNIDEDFDDKKLIKGTGETEEPLGVVTHSQYVPSNDTTPSMEDEVVDENVEEAAWVVIRRGASNELWTELFCKLSHEEIMQRVALVFADQDVVLDIDRNQDSITRVAVFIKDLALKSVKKGM